jgi:S-adenosyl methyltransferase
LPRRCIFLTASQADARVGAFKSANDPAQSPDRIGQGLDRHQSVLIERLAAAYVGTAGITARTEAEIVGCLADLNLVPTGLVDVWAWRPDTEDTSRRPA